MAPSPHPRRRAPNARLLLRAAAPASVAAILLLLLLPPAGAFQIQPGLRSAPLTRTHAASSNSSSSITETADRVRTGEASAMEVVKEALGRIQAEDGRIGAFLAVSGDRAVAAAKALDARLANKGDAAARALPLLGLPVAVKDNICTAGVPTTAASRVLEGYVPSYDATSVARLVAAGAIVVGKTNMDEFGMGSTTETSGYHVTRNPRDLTRSPGGSSGGSAAAVAAGMVAAALGTDTGGSIRQPAAWTGTVGLKPTYGRVSRHGLLAYGSSTDTIGPLANSVTDAALLLAAVAGPDPSHDATTAGAPPVGDCLAGLKAVEAAFFAGGGKPKPLQGLRVGLVKETLETRVEPAVAEAVRDAVDALADLGAEVVSVSIPYLDAHCASYYVNVLSEASANLARYDGFRYGRRAPRETAKGVMLDSRAGGFGEEVKQRVLLGTFSLSAGYADAYYLKAQQLRSVLSHSFADAFSQADVLVCPTAPRCAYPLGRAAKSKVEMYADDLFTVPASLAGLPAISLPTAAAAAGGEGLPIGLQIIGRRFGEDEMLRVARAFELARDG